jgi:peptidoglycan/LPS O-acetylase OafA/YrhL
MQHKKHFETLDGLRGLVAFVVLAYHILSPIGLSSIVPRGYLGVDFFFVLSGFVIAIAYERRLLGGMTFPEFFAIRMLRLYPLLLAGMAFGAVVTSGKLILTHQFNLFDFAKTSFWAVLILPFGEIGQQHTSFPFDAPAWSLFYELLINFVYALLIAQLTTARLSAVAVVSGLALIVTAFYIGNLNVGGDLSTFAPALIRVTFSFSVGLLLGRQIRLGWFADIPSIQPIWLVAVLVTLFCVPATSFEPAFQALCVVALFPVIVLLGAAREPSHTFLPIARLSGRISYPLYILHHPLQRTFQAFIDSHHLEGAKLALIVVVVEFITALALAYAALIIYDEPIRRAFGYGRQKTVRMGI